MVNGLLGTEGELGRRSGRKQMNKIEEKPPDLKFSSGKEWPNLRWVKEESKGQERGQVLPRSVTLFLGSLVFSGGATRDYVLASYDS